ncbi:DUF5336 domain-containing protein [Prosthecobacter sp.]|uniref:DUF5336 domain-containing protein n=1 Tax=Prosthecobacter sp. TaxID=1965333 RepID=UPI003784DC3C
MSYHRTSNSRRFHRYCIECGWGHTEHAWNMATFCVQCGAHLPKHSAVDGDQPRQAKGGTSRKRTVRANEDVEVIPPPRNHASGTWARKNDGQPRKVRNGKHSSRHHDSADSEDWVSQAQSFVGRNPYTSATIGAAAGGLAIAAGGALATAGGAIAAMGGTVMGASAVIGLLATFGSMVGPKRNPKTAYAGACLAIVGGLIGAAISVTGALVSALGVALGFAGTVVISVSALVAAARSAQLCWEHREDIKRLLGAIKEKLPGAKTVKFEVQKELLELRPVIK